MSWKPSETEIIDYLYGSLPKEMKERFDDYLKKDKAFAKEVEALRLTQKILPVLSDEEVIAPLPFAEGAPPIRQSVVARWIYPVSIAASITLILLTGYFTQFRMSFNDQGFSVGFAGPTEYENTMTQEDVQKMINNTVDEATMRVNQKLESFESGFNTQLANNKVITEEQIRRLASNSSVSTLDDQQVLQYITQLKEENKKLMQNFYKVSADEQRTYMRNILLDYSEYLESQRQEDLRLIQANMLDLKSNSEIKQEVTDKLLANIITTMNNQYPVNDDRISLD